MTLEGMQPLFVLHVALQGCLRGENVEYGVTADTGGHIRYLFGLIEATERCKEIERIVVATRAFESEFGPDYARPIEALSAKTQIVRFPTVEPGYLAKEALWREVPAYAEALIAWIEAQERKPDILHAHYADAGVVAEAVRARLGIPFLFTAHSLGRVKMQAFEEQGRDTGPNGAEATARRLASEECALAKAALVIASSRDEAEQQWAGYEAYDPGRVRVIPPGAELDVFGPAVTSAKVEEMIGRFLRQPEKPVLLAIARPVEKKNLAGLLHAFGQSQGLRDRANLVLIAGTRTDIAALEAESADCLREILALIDLYDLYGSIAYPKAHDPDDVPAIYAYARARRGIFVNPALNEPFGLTLLEAAAAGLPIIATENGGPNDIVELCQNGVLINPNEPGAIAEAALRILGEPDLWQRYASAGADAVGRFDWTSHALRYHRLVRAVIAKRGRREVRARELLVCDIDNTLVGSKEAISDFSAWHARQRDTLLAVATGRSFHSALSVLEQESAPLPDWMITSVGSEIYIRAAEGPNYEADQAWAAWIDHEWDRDAIVEALSDVSALRPQAALEQRRFKISYLVGKGETLLEAVEERLRRADLRCSIIFSHGRYLDILPARASKGAAVAFLRRKLNLEKAAVIVAGDSGNDREMLRSSAQGIIVANFCDDLDRLPDLAHCHVAERPYAWGVMEGVAHFRGQSGPLLPGAST